MNKSTQRVLLALSLSSALASGGAAAASWQDQLNSAASQLGSQNNSGNSSSANGGMSVSSLAGLLNGGDKAVSSSTMTNAAGVMEYCVKNNVVDNNVSSVKNQVLNKLGLNTQTEKAQQTDYQEGIMGLLNTGNGQQLNLKTLGNTEMGKKVKTKACDVVLKQGKNYLS